MNDKYEGIILKQNDYRENDALISVLFKDLGKYTLSCKGVRKLTSKNSMSVRPFLTSEFLFDYVETKSMFNLKNATVIKSRKNITENLTKMSLSTLICQIVDVTHLNDYLDILDEVFNLLEFCLDKINNENYEILTSCLFIASYLDIIGLKPNVDGCTMCSSSQISGISITEGGFLCKTHSSNVSTIKDLDLDNLKKFRLINKADISNYEVLKNLIDFNMKDLNVLIEFFEYHTGIKLNSSKILNMII